MLHADGSGAADALLDQWHAARSEHGPAAVAMIVRDNQTRELLNHLARQRLQAHHQLPSVGVRIGAREYAPGDRVIARRNDRRQEVDNGTLGTIVAIDAGNMQVRTDSGETRTLERSYVAGHMEHAYALTAHGAQGATVTWAGVLGRPEEFTREWAYTALSRAREKTVVHIAGSRPIGPRDTQMCSTSPTLGAAGRRASRPSAARCAAARWSRSPPSSSRWGIL